MRNLALLAAALVAMTAPAHAQHRPRAREAGIVIGILPTGPLNAITDVAGVKVGQVTIIEGANIRTGVTAILPHGGNLYQDRFRPVSRSAMPMASSWARLRSRSSARSKLRSC